MQTKKSRPDVEISVERYHGPKPPASPGLHLLRDALGQAMDRYISMDELCREVIDAMHVNLLEGNIKCETKQGKGDFDKMIHRWRERHSDCGVHRPLRALTQEKSNGS